LAFFFLALITGSVFFAQYVNRHKGEYTTREDEGALDASDADTAVLQGKTGHHVEKKKEWFI
jgi:contactin associated protein-like 2